MAMENHRTFSKKLPYILVLWSISQLAIEIHFRWGWFAEAVPLRERGALNDGDSVGRGYWFEPSDVIANSKFTLEFGLMSICLFKVGALQSCFQYRVFVQT